MKIRQISLQAPAIEVETSSYVEKLVKYFENIKILANKLLLKVSGLVMNLVKRGKQDSDIASSYPTKKKYRFPINGKKKLKKSLVLILIIPLFFAGIIYASKLFTSSPEKDVADDRMEVAGARSYQDINREFTFPLTDDSGEEVGNIKYLIENAELRNEIVVNGQKATSIKGRTFLIINLKISNDYSKSVEINTRDYMRLSVNGNEDEWLAPDIHNDPVEVQAISTKNTRLGFPIYEADMNMILRVGEINGEKQEIELNL